MELGGLVVYLTKELKGLVKQDRIEEAAYLALDNVPHIFEFSKGFIPPKAEVELKVKDRCDGSYYSNKVYAARQNLSEKRYGFEEELLEAKHPKRVQKLWEEAKPRLEQLYGRPFESRRDLAVMNTIFNGQKHVLRDADDLREVLTHYHAIKAAAEENPTSGWKMVQEVWKEHYLKTNLGDFANKFLGHLTDMRYPKKIAKEGDLKWNFATELRIFDNPSWEWLGIDQLKYFTTMVLDAEAGRLSFRKALDMVNSEYAKEAGLEYKRGFHGSLDVPDEVRGLVNEQLRKHYANRGNDPDVAKFLQWYSGMMLERWNKTAVDHDRLFDFHEPDHWDSGRIKFFYKLREGLDLDKHDDKVIIDRLPEVLRSLVGDGVIKSEDIDPPLKPYYRKPSEIINVHKALPNGKNKFVLDLKMEPHEPQIVTGVDQKVLSYVTDNLPALRDDLSALGKMFDPEKQYHVIYKGNHTLLIAAEEYYPSGKQHYGDIYRVSMLREDANPKEGVQVVVGGQRFNVKREKDYSLKEKIEEAQYDINNNAIPINTCTVIVDMQPEEFRKRYFRDFMAHALLNKDEICDDQSLEQRLEKIDSIGTTDYYGIVGFAGRTELSTFQIADRFGFQLKIHREWGSPDLALVLKSLTDYLSDVGLAFHVEADINEAGRNRIEYKKREREFQEENFESVVKSLQGENLAKLLCSIMEDDRYHFWNFGVSREPCKVCGREYYDGIASRPDLKEQWCDGFMGEDLHHIASHPHTFINKGYNLRKIHHALMDTKEAPTPAFITHPGVVDNLYAFAKAFKEYSGASSKAFNFWYNTQGGVHEEEEEIEENPELKRLADEEHNLYKAESDLEKKAHEAAIALQTKYEELGGKKIKNHKKNVAKLSSFWNRQLTMLEIYKLNSSRLLLGFTGHPINDLSMKLYWNR
ncbi:MAG: hypothetical protein V1645_00940 [archaeon]